MDTKVILITGSTDGIGEETALRLVDMGHKVIIHGRSKDKLDETATRIADKTGSEVYDSFAADLENLKAVKEMAGRVKEKYDRLDILINNAGVFEKQRELTADGFEKTFAVNHLSHFLLTNELLPLLKGNAHSRIVIVSSRIHASYIDFDNLQGEKSYDGSEAYSRSKLANLLHAKALARKLDASDVTVNAVHPGAINTKLLKKAFGPFGHSTKRGAENLLYVALEEELKNVSGKYFEDQKEVAPAEIADDESAQDRLWKLSEEGVNMS